MSLSNASAPRCLVTNSLMLSSRSEGGGSTSPIAPRPALQPAAHTHREQAGHKRRDKFQRFNSTTVKTICASTFVLRHRTSVMAVYLVSFSGQKKGAFGSSTLKAHTPGGQALDLQKEKSAGERAQSQTLFAHNQKPRPVVLLSAMMMLMLFSSSQETAIFYFCFHIRISIIARSG